MSSTRLEQIAARVDPDVLEVIETEAARERRPISHFVRNVLTDHALRLVLQRASPEHAA